MTALHTTFAFNGPAIPALRSTPAIVRTRSPGKLVKNMLLFLASPFIGLAYAVLLPFVGLGMLLWIATEGLREPKARDTGRVEEAVAVYEVPAPVAQCAAPAAAEEAQARGITGFLLVAAKVIAAPFAGLAFVVAMPFVALGTLAWVAIGSIRTA